MYNFFSGCDSEDLMEFSADVAVNPFGAELARLSAEVYDDIDEAIEDITDGLIARGIDVDEDMVYGFFSGDYLPTEATLEALSEFCIDEDGELDTISLDRFLSSAEASHEIAEQLSIQLEDSQDGYYEDDEVDQNIGAYYEDEDEEDEYEVDPETEALRAEVENLTTRQVVTDDLDALVEYGKDLMAEGKLPPIAFSALLGGAEDTSTSRFAEFSSVCEADESDVFGRLDKIEFCLNVFERCGPFMNFSSMAPESLQVTDFDQEEDEAVAGMLEAYRSN